ncbi:hypothetical protein HK405_015624, partial [Cladochytrium tenue]
MSCKDDDGGTPAPMLQLDEAAADSEMEERIKREGAENDAVYFLPSDDGERKRLQIQHVVFRHLFGGLFHTPQKPLFDDPTAAARILDVGCGPGSWTIEMAVKFPHALFAGGRFLVTAIRKDQWPQVIKELIRVTKSGGYIQLVE